MTIIKQAMIFAAGYGSRMKHLTQINPKPMLKIRGKSFIDRIIDKLINYGINKIVVNVSYKAEILIEYLSRRKDAAILISKEDKPLGNGGGALQAIDFFEGKPFFAINSDVILIDKGIGAFELMQQTWDSKKMYMLLLTAPTNGVIGYEGDGDFDLDDQSKILYARDEKMLKMPLFFTGLQLIDPEIFSYVNQTEFSLNIFYKKNMQNNLRKGIFGAIYQGQVFNAETPEALYKVEQYFLDNNLQ